MQVNTYVEDTDNTSDTKEQSQIELNIENSKCTKIRASTVANSICDNKNQKNDNSNFDIYKETSEIDMFEKEKTKLEPNDHLNEAIVPFVRLENDRDSLDFLDLNIPDIASDECLNNSKEEENSFKTGNSVKIKRNVENLEKCNLNDNDVPNKKLKIISSSEIKNMDENLIDKNVNAFLDVDVKTSYSRSPSLFDDSLNLDTQMCDILEQNAHTSQQRKSVSPNGENVRVREENDAENTRVSTNVAHLPLKTSVLSWGDDSWNDSELLKKVVQDNNRNAEGDISKHKIRDIVNTSALIMPVNTKTCARDSKENLRNTNVKKRATTIKEKESRKSILLKVAAAQSPVASVFGFKNERRMSVDSSKSDPDEIVVESQYFESPFSGNKSRTRTQLEKLREMRSQKLAEDTTGETSDCANSSLEEISNDMAQDRTQWKAKSKTAKAVSRIKQRETRSSVSNKSAEPKAETVSRSDDEKDLLNQTTDWNALNIVKVANDRATFSLFKREIMKKRSISLALHCDLYVDNANSIGSKIYTSNTEIKRKSKRSGSYAHRNREIRGAAISWESNIAYYISFQNSQGTKNVKIPSIIAF